MSALTDPFYNRKQLIDIAVENQIDKKYHDTFIEMVELCMQDLYNDNELPEAERDAITIRQSLEEIGLYIIEIERGHSESWARTYADSSEDELDRIRDTYVDLRKKNNVEAREQLELHIKSFGKDEIYNKHLFLLITDGPFEKYSRLQEQAEVFSRTFKQQKDIGGSDLFAKEYSDLIAEGGSELYAFSFATLYEEAIAEGRSEGFAYNYAEELAECIDNNWRNFDEALGDEYFKFRRSEVTAALSKY